MHTWTWPRLVAAHHDYHPEASAEILRRLVGALPAALDPLVAWETRFRLAEALELNLLERFDRPGFSMHIRVDPTTDRPLTKLQRLQVDWATLVQGRVDVVVHQAIRLTRKRLEELDAPDDHPVNRPADSDEPDLWKGAEHSLPRIYLDVVDPRISLVLVAFNRWNRNRRPEDWLERADSIETDKQRADLVPIVQKLADGRGDALRELRRAVQAVPALAEEVHALHLAFNRLLREVGTERPVAVLSEVAAAGSTRAQVQVAVWMTRTAMKVAYSFSVSKKGLYQPRGLRPDTNELLEAWGYRSADRVLREAGLKASYDLMHQAIQSALRAREEL